MDSDAQGNNRLLGRFSELTLLWTFLAWFAISDVAPIVLGDRGYPPGIFAFIWAVLHYSLNPLLACLVAGTLVVRAFHGRRGSTIAFSLVIVPVLILVAFLASRRMGSGWNCGALRCARVSSDDR